ncbi:hypothetical protein [Streptomyces sp. G-G2]|uniref:hypothetical protein n=1 Tax=Streptomyces sp. G-G2 TaxID=3046201 RepID=UPI0024BB57F9|nr:hypothetical protein [Streptomyces sp. G-G2]MDJ0382656.1 hypothetical protein [Streptomyces sp. G-G2]
MNREDQIARAVAYVLAHTEQPPEGPVAADWASYLAGAGSLVAHGVRLFHSRAEGHRAPSTDQALAAWDAAVRLGPATDPWTKAVALAYALQDLLREEDERHARRRARQEQPR